MGLLFALGRLGDAKGRGDEEAANAFFTASVLLMIVLAYLLWVLFALFHDAVFIFFGASEEILPKVMEYAKWIIRLFPIFIAPTFIGSFVRNDRNPRLAMAAVIAGDGLNRRLQYRLLNLNIIFKSGSLYKKYVFISPLPFTSMSMEFP